MDPIWRQSYPPDVPATIDTAGIGTLAALAATAFERYAGRDAYHSQGRTLRYGEIDEMSVRFATFLRRELGTSPGDRIALMCPNVLAFPVALFGNLRAGLVQVNVNPFYTAPELRHQLIDAGVETIVAIDTAVPVIERVLPETGVRTAVIIAEGGSSGHRELPGVRTHTFETVLASTPCARDEMPMVEPDDLAFLQYTGGTTGLAKGAMLSHANVLANVLAFDPFLGPPLPEGDEIVVTATPLYHILGLVVNCLTFVHRGGLNLLVRDPRDLPAFVEALRGWRFSVITGVNTLFNGLLGTPGFEALDFSNLRLAMGGGTPIQETVSRRWHAVTGRYIKEGYGMSEAGGLTQTPLELEVCKSTIGLPFPGLDVSLRGDDGREVSVGETGELCVKGPSVMRGYWNRASDDDMTPDGYFRTGDIARMDDEGYLEIVDRMKDLILVSGFNVYPAEVEAAVSAAPGVFECACVGVPDERTGEAVKVFAVLQTGATANVEELRRHCRRRLAPYKVPKQIEFIDALPKSPVGKILRRELRRRE